MINTFEAPEDIMLALRSTYTDTIFTYCKSCATLAKCDQHRDDDRAQCPIEYQIFKKHWKHIMDNYDLEIPKDQNEIVELCILYVKKWRCERYEAVFGWFDASQCGMTKESISISKLITAKKKELAIQREQRTKLSGVGKNKSKKSTPIDSTLAQLRKSKQKGELAESDIESIKKEAKLLIAETLKKIPDPTDEKKVSEKEEIRVGDETIEVGGD